MDRLDVIAGMFDRSGLGLEIGPSYNPIVPKASGANIETLDYADRATLVEKYKAIPGVDFTKIEAVDYVSDGRSISEIITNRGCYDYIIASHVIEHLPNVIGFINDCSLLLKDSGVLLFVVPDRRYCFDYFRPATTSGALLQAFRERRTRHPVGLMFDHVAYAARRGGAIAWSDQDRGRVTFVHTLQDAVSLFSNYNPDVLYADYHAWQFTPSSFRLIMRDLADMAILDLRERAFHDTVGCEFYITLSRAAPSCSIDRLTLAEMAVDEALPSQMRSPIVSALERADDEQQGQVDNILPSSRDKKLNVKILKKSAKHAFKRFRRVLNLN